MEQTPVAVRSHIKKSFWFMQWTITWMSFLDIILPLGITLTLLFTGNSGNFLGELVFLWVAGVWKQLSFMESRAEFIEELEKQAQQKSLTREDLHGWKFFWLMVEILLVYFLVIMISMNILLHITTAAGWTHNAIESGAVLLSTLVAVGVFNACWHFISASALIEQEDTLSY